MLHFQVYQFDKMQEQKVVNILEQFREFPSLLKYLNKHFDNGDEVLQKTLLNSVDESEFSLHEWVESLLLIDQWLEQNNLILSTRNSIEYISCAAAAGKSPGLCHLPSVVSDFLEQYGCELAVKK